MDTATLGVATLEEGAAMSKPLRASPPSKKAAP
jgi:hypothetical protein